MKRILIGALLLSSTTYSQPICQPPSDLFAVSPDSLVPLIAKVNQNTLNLLAGSTTIANYFDLCTNLDGSYNSTTATNLQLTTPIEILYLPYAPISNYPHIQFTINANNLIGSDWRCSSWIADNIGPDVGFSPGITNQPLTCGNFMVSHQTQYLPSNNVLRMRILIAKSPYINYSDQCPWPPSGQTNAPLGTIIDIPIRIVTTLGTNSYQRTNLSVYPNPTNGVVNFGNPEDLNYELFDMDSRLVLKGTGKSTDISGMSPGVYMLRTSDGNGRGFINKIIKN
jgi:hypothetical protein